MDININDTTIYIGDIVDNLAKLEFHIEGNYAFIDNIYISNHLRGQGIASDLLEYLLNYCKEHSLKINPSLIELNKII